MNYNPKLLLELLGKVIFILFPICIPLVKYAMSTELLNSSLSETGKLFESL